MERETNYDDALDIITEFPDQDDFVCRNIRQFINYDGEADDNSIELAHYWESCKILVNTRAREIEKTVE
jgi:hypothetical protein